MAADFLNFYFKFFAFVSEILLGRCGTGGSDGWWRRYTWHVWGLVTWHLVRSRGLDTVLRWCAGSSGDRYLVITMVLIQLNTVKLSTFTGFPQNLEEDNISTILQYRDSCQIDCSRYPVLFVTQQSISNCCLALLACFWLCLARLERTNNFLHSVQSCLTKCCVCCTLGN